tara:strand:+ start:1740 stop:2951 length:1212 start_codon:yes stop_codon:yes gene_type:complete
MAIDYTSIDEVVNDFQLMMDDTSYDKDAEIYQLRLLALQGLRELKFDAEQEVKIDELFVNSSTLQCTLPSDFVKLLRVGYKNSADEFVSLGYKSNLSLDARVTSQISEDPYDENNPYFHTDMGRKYGVGGGQNALGYYRLNRNLNSISFSSELAGKTVFVEYISDGIGSTQPRDHVIELTFNKSSLTASGAIVSGAILKTPKPDGTGVHEFTFTTGSPSSSSLIQIGPNDSSPIVAEKFSTVINEGYPNLGISPVDTRITASQNTSSNIVTLTYKNIIVNPLSLENLTFAINTDQDVVVSDEVTITGVKVLADSGGVPIEAKLIQKGVIGEGPRVHKFCEEALRCYIYYKYIQRKRGVPANEKQMAKRAYYNEKRLARARMMNFNKEAAMQISRKAFKQSPKI